MHGEVSGSIEVQKLVAAEQRLAEALPRRKPCLFGFSCGVPLLILGKELRRGGEFYWRGGAAEGIPERRVDSLLIRSLGVREEPLGEVERLFADERVIQQE